MAPPERYQPPAAVAMARTLARRWWGAELVVVERSGALPAGPVAAPDNEVCRRATASPEGARRCGASISYAHDEARAKGSLAVVRHECHLGFELVAAAGPEGVEEGLVLCGIRGRPADGEDERRLADRLRELRADPRATDEEPAYPPKQLDLKPIQELVAAAAAELTRESRRGEPRREKGRREAGLPLVGQSLAMIEVQRLVERVAGSDSTVLVQGESGTGKELVARRIHDLSTRRDRPFVAQNCSAFNDNLLESALFGHVRGAFTGAAREAPGLFDLADGGTLFLDEIGDTSPALQVKLLRVLQEGTFTPVGGSEERRVDVRVLTASHKDLADQVQRRLFREDLYYRINVIRLVVPPLRDRPEDLPLLVRHFFRRYARTEPNPQLAPATLALFTRYGWPGNVRELQNEIERLCVLAGDEPIIGPEHVSPRIVQAADAPKPAPAPRPAGEGPVRLNDAVEALERQLLADSLERNGGNRSRVARELGIARSNLLLKLEKYGLGEPARRRGRAGG